MPSRHSAIRRPVYHLTLEAAQTGTVSSLIRYSKQLTNAVVQCKIKTAGKATSVQRQATVALYLASLQSAAVNMRSATCRRLHRFPGNSLSKQGPLNPQDIKLDSLVLFDVKSSVLGMLVLIMLTDPHVKHDRFLHIGPASYSLAAVCIM